MSTTTIRPGARVYDRWGRTGVVVRHSPTLPAWVVQRLGKNSHPTGSPLTYLDGELRIDHSKDAR